jgi:acyl-coenzyme A thioesterase PaaI-like protein
VISKVHKTASFFKRLPGGRWMFSRLVGWFVPYAGTLRADILEMAEGSAVVSMPDRRAVRNHLHSIHALALANLGELTANLALLTLCPPHGRFIVTRLEVDYLKKARGTLTCTCDVPADLPWTTIERTAATANLTDGEGDTVTRVTVYWKLDVKPPTNGRPKGDVA